MKKILLIIIIIAGISMFFVNAEVSLDNDAKVIVEGNRIYLKSFEDKILLDLYYGDLEYNVSVSNDVYLINGSSNVLGGTGKHYKVYVVDAQGKVWHSDEFKSAIRLEDDTLFVTSDNSSISYNLESKLEAFREEGANFKIDLIYDEGLDLSEPVNYKEKDDVLYLAYEVKSFSLNSTMCLLFIKLDHKLDLLNMAMGDYNSDMESILD